MVRGTHIPSTRGRGRGTAMLGVSLLGRDNTAFLPVMQQSILHQLSSAFGLVASIRSSLVDKQEAAWANLSHQVQPTSTCESADSESDAEVVLQHKKLNQW